MVMSAWLSCSLLCGEVNLRNLLECPLFSDGTLMANKLFFILYLEEKFLFLRPPVLKSVIVVSTCFFYICIELSCMAAAMSIADRFKLGLAPAADIIAEPFKMLSSSWLIWGGKTSDSDIC